MVNTAHLRAVMEEEEIKGMLHKTEGRNQEFEHALEQNDELAHMKFHQIDIPTLILEMDSDEKNGLTDEKVQKKLAEIGPNKLEEKKQYPWYVKLLLEMVGIFSLLLWAGAALCFTAYALQPSDPSNVLYLLFLILSPLIKE